MSIDICKDGLLTMSQVAAMLPRTPSGRKKSAATVLRWTRAGRDGVVLESVKLGATTYTTAEALQRFGTASAGGKEPVRLQTRREKGKGYERVRKELEKLGIK